MSVKSYKDILTQPFATSRSGPHKATPPQPNPTINYLKFDKTIKENWIARYYYVKQPHPIMNVIDDVRCCFERDGYGMADQLFHYIIRNHFGSCGTVKYHEDDYYGSWYNGSWYYRTDVQYDSLFDAFYHMFPPTHSARIERFILHVIKTRNERRIRARTRHFTEELAIATVKK